MSTEKIIDEITERLANLTRVNAVFGETRVIGNKAIIPVTLICLGFGAGAGQGPESEEGIPKGEGGGGGGGGSSKPVGVIEVTDATTRFIPTLDMTSVTLASLAVVGLSTWLITRLIGKVRK